MQCHASPVFAKSSKSREVSSQQKSPRSGNDGHWLVAIAVATPPVGDNVPAAEFCTMRRRSKIELFDGVRAPPMPLGPQH